MKKHLPLTRPALALCLGLALPLTLAAQPVGQWDFNTGNLTGTVGSDLIYADGTGGSTELATQFGATSALGIPMINGTNAQVMAFPASVFPMGYLMPAPMAANGGGSLVNDYTLIMDVLFPVGSSGKLRPLVSTDGGFITPEADLVVSATDGVGTTEGPFFGSLVASNWYRLGIVVEGSARSIRFYLNGAPIGTTTIVDAFDSRFALLPGGSAHLFAGLTTNAPGYVNSIQMRDTALSQGQMAALGGPSAEGIPQVIPAVPAYVEQWSPVGAMANRILTLGATINLGDTTIATNSLVLRLDGVAQTGLTISSNAVSISIFKSNAGPLSVGPTHTLTITGTNGLGAQVTFSKQFKVAFLFEDFEGLALQNAVEEANAMTNAWTPTPPVGWVTNHSGMPGYGDPANDGRTEWAGWTFAKKSFWLASDGQTREQFTRGTGTLAIADPDEWDDAAHPTTDAGGNSLYFNSFLTTPTISVSGLAPNALFVKFDSSWRPEGFDDWGGTNNQTGTVTISYNGGAPVEILHWDSQEGGPFFHQDSQNEAVYLPLGNPAGVTNIVLTFGMTKAANDWWWAFDNLEVSTGPVAPAISAQPQSLIVSTGAVASFSVTATGSEPLAYQWLFNGNSLGAQTSSSLTLSNVQTANAGGYSVIVANEGGSVTSKVANLTIFTGSITQDLVVHLKFDGTYADASGRGNAAFAVNEPTFEAGFLGQGVHTTSTTTNSPNNYVSLGQPTDLQFGSDLTSDAVDLSFSFWTRVLARADDKPFISNKDWDSGSNRGLVIASKSGGMLWNYRDDVSSRRDSPTVGPALNDTGWHHVAVTFERSNVGRIYVDGVLVNTTSVAPNAGAQRGSVDTSSLGLNWNLGQDGAGDYTDGNAAALEMVMDDLGMWRRVITPQEIEAIYHGGFFTNDLAHVSLYGPLPKPMITFPPTNLVVSAGSAATFNVSALGGNPLTYQWRFAGTNVVGATNRTYTLATAGLTNAGNYSVVVANASGSVTSSVASLTVLAAPIITTHPQARTNNQNLDVSLSVTVSGGGLAYQWLHDGVTVTNGTNATLVLASLQPVDAGNYWVLVTNSSGSATSSNALITVLPVPTIRLTGQWDFDQGDLAATVGLPLDYFDATVQADTAFGSQEIAGLPAGVLRFVPSLAKWGGYKMYHNTAPNAGGPYVNQYTLLCDVFYPLNSHNQWRAFLQTSTTDANDGEFFVSSANGIGISGNYQGTVTPTNWHRIAFAVDLSSPLSPAVAKWIDGVKVGYQIGLSGGKNGRFSLDVFALLFADEDGENSETLVSSVQFWNGKLPDSFLSSLGPPTAAKLPGGINIKVAGGNVQIHRTGGLRLEQADSLTGPWTEIVGAPDPYVAPASSAAKFYRPKF
jgi:hypothetical protein